MTQPNSPAVCVIGPAGHLQARCYGDGKEGGCKGRGSFQQWEKKGPLDVREFLRGLAFVKGKGGISRLLYYIFGSSDLLAFSFLYLSF